MLQSPMDIVSLFPVRKTKKQKQVFRDAVCMYAQKLGYPFSVEPGKFGAQNVVFGDPESASCLITAHYDTCARLPFPNFITPCNALVFYLSRVVIWTGMILFCGILAAGCGLLFGQKWISLFGAMLVGGFFVLMLFGPANKTNVNDNTSGVVALLEIARGIPYRQRKNVCFVLFDLEEAGLIGSASYRKTHKAATDHQLVLNLDCVGDGDHILMMPTRKLKKDRKKLSSLYTVCGYFGRKSLLVRDKGFCVYPSDQRSFPFGVGICALNKGKAGLYLSRIHTPKDTVLDITNINILRAALISYITCNAANRKEEMK